MSNDNAKSETATERPLVFYQVVEADVSGDELYAHAGNLYPNRETAEKEVEEQRQAYERLLEGDSNGFDLKEWFIEEVHLSPWQVKKASRMDEERHKIMEDAVSAVGTALLAEDTDV
jgi:hypothetical protein